MKNMKMKSTLLLLVLSCFFLVVKAKADTLINVDSANFYLSKAKESKQARKVWDAEKFFQKAIEFDPNNESIKMEFANYYIEQRKYGLANQQYNIILQKNPSNVLATSKVIELSYNLKKWTDVIKNGEAAIAKNIKVEKVHFMVAKAYFEDENYGLARRYLTTQIGITPKDKATIELLGKVYVELSLFPDAIAMYEKVLKETPNDADLIYEMGMLYSAQHKEKDAVKYYEMALEKGMKADLAYWENLGMSYLTFDIKKGVEVLNKVLEKKPGDVEILTQIAQAYYKSEQFGTSYELYYKMFENDNKNVKALYMAGVSLIRKGDKGKGSAICDKAIAMDPSLGELRSQKAVM